MSGTASNSSIRGRWRARLARGIQFEAISRQVAQQLQMHCRIRANADRGIEEENAGPTIERMRHGSPSIVRDVWRSGAGRGGGHQQRTKLFIRQRPRRIVLEIGRDMCRCSHAENVDPDTGLAK